MSEPRISLENALAMRQMVVDGNRTGAYIYYHELTGSSQILEHAQTSQFSGFIGGTADVANRIVQFIHPNYPEAGVLPFSQQIAQVIADRVVEDVRRGGTGIFSDKKLRQITREVWDSKRLNYMWPGDIHDNMPPAPFPFSAFNWTPGAAIAAGSAIVEIATLGRLYGHARSDFTDLKKYKWTHIKPHRTDISYAVDRQTNKVVYIELSRFGVLQPPESASPTASKPAPGKGPIRDRPVSDSPRRLPLTPEQRDIALFMKRYGLKATDLTPEIKSALVQASRIPRSNSQNLQETLTTWSETFRRLEQLATAANKPKVLYAAQIGSRVIDVVQQTAALPGAIAQAPNALAAVHPILGLATAAFSLAGLLKGRSGPDPMEALMRRIQGIENSLANIHRDLIEGVNLIVQGQMQIYSTMLERFGHIETVVQQQAERLGTAILADISRLEGYLTFVHADLSDQIQRLYLQRFNELKNLLQNAISPEKSRATRKSQLGDLATRELVTFESWLTKEAGSDMLNGYRFIGVLAHLDVQNAEKLIQTKLISEHGIRLECFVGYLGQVAASILKEDIFGPDLANVVNPVIWLVGASTYVDVLQNIADLEIEHDPAGAKLDEICQKGEQYKNFIVALQRSSKSLFEKLLDKHRQYVDAVLQKGRSVFFETLKNQYSLQNNVYFQASSCYVFNQSKITTDIINSLQLPFINQFVKFREFMTREVQNAETKYFETLEKIIVGIHQNHTREQLIALVDRPIAPYARHKPNSTHGESFLDMWHASEHWSRFEDFGFKIPFVLTALFENAPELKASIPKILYLAEILRIGNFEMTATAKYTHATRASWPKPEHAALRQYTSYNNYKYTFEVFFVVNSVKSKICEFDCTSEQLPLSNDMLESASLCTTAQQRCDALHRVGAPFEYWFVAMLYIKTIIMNQVPKFKTIQRFVPCPLAQLEQNLINPIDLKLNDLRRRHQEFYRSSLNEADLRDQMEDVQSSRNLILAYMYLCGFDNDDVDSVRNLWGRDGIMQVMRGDQDAAGAENTITLFSRQQAAAQESLRTLLQSKIPNNVLKGYKVADVELMLGLLTTCKLQRGGRLVLSEDEIAEVAQLYEASSTAPIKPHAKPAASALPVNPTSVDKITLIRRICKNAQLIIQRQSGLAISEVEQRQIYDKIEKCLKKPKYDHIFSKITTEHSQLRIAELIAAQAKDPRFGLTAKDKKLRSQVIRSAVEQFLKEVKHPSQPGS